MECRFQKHLDKPDNIRDEYDDCISVKSDELKSVEGCKKRCEEFCEKKDMKYDASWHDFTGCHCYCQLKLS